MLLWLLMDYVSCGAKARAGFWGPRGAAEIFALLGEERYFGTSLSDKD